MIFFVSSFFLSLDYFASGGLAWICMPSSCDVDPFIWASIACLLFFLTHQISTPKTIDSLHVCQFFFQDSQKENGGKLWVRDQKWRRWPWPHYPLPLTFPPSLLFLPSAFVVSLFTFQSTVCRHPCHRRSSFFFASSSISVFESASKNRRS